jgi:hypothetical protein
MTDEMYSNKNIGPDFASHETVNQSKDEYVRGEAHTSTVEGFYLILKRGMSGVHQHCAEKHLHRCLSKFDFRYSNRVALGIDDVARAERVLKGVRGKRLAYRTTNSQGPPYGKSRRAKKRKRQSLS